ncbi:hypothetical protein FHR55_003450 [Xanthomonas arboricola]|uniref:hypothetical protein n=1 Tax=Xanthomonas euvesicatoria TaxID=456327 RepID=UPI0016158190|nr:hypothetical protein [Xanthomonas euvesicatoria]MBV6829687.1 hypothetical protein [Xanthomonas campestris pv. viegasii]
MKLKIFAAIAAGVVLCSCDSDGAPKISLDEKLTCGALIEARAINDAVTYGNIWKMPINAAARTYGTATEIEAYFKNSVLADSTLVSDMHRKIYERCVADSDKSLASAFRNSLDQSFEQNKDSARYGVCVAFNNGRIAIEDAMAIIIAREGKFDTNVDANDPRIPIVRNALTERCSADPSSRVLKHIEWVSWELQKKEQEQRDQARLRAEQDMIRESLALSHRIQSELVAGHPPSCADMLRLTSGPSSESAETVSNAATDASLNKLPVEQAAYIRDNIHRSSLGVDFKSCADINGNVDDAVDEYNLEKSEISDWATRNQGLIHQEMIKRDQVKPQEKAGRLTEEQELELQREQAARFDAEELHMSGSEQ